VSVRGVKSGLLSLAALFGVLILSLPACSTLMTVPGGTKYLMGGTRANIEAMGPRPDPEPLMWRTPPSMAFLDFPCSLALDLVLVPLTLPLQLIHGDAPRSSPPPIPPEEQPKKPE